MRLRLDWCSFEAARYATKNWHYSRSMPASKIVKVGVWEDGKFIGCVLFSRGANPRLVRPFGLDQTEGCELTRIALRSHKTPVSRIMSMAVKFLRRQCPGMRIVVSYADPAQGHVGAVYQAAGWAYLGMTQPTKFPVMNGKVTHSRAVGCRQRDGAWIRRESLTWVQQQGKHRYALGLDCETRQLLATLAKPYPKRASDKGDGTPPGAQRQFDSDPDAPALQTGTVRRSTPRSSVRNPKEKPHSTEPRRRQKAEPEEGPAPA